MRNKVVISLLTATAVPMGAMANADVSAKVEASDAHKLTAEGQTGHLSEAGMLAAQALIIAKTKRAKIKNETSKTSLFSLHVSSLHLDTINAD